VKRRFKIPLLIFLPLVLALMFTAADIAAAYGPSQVPWSTAKTDWIDKSTGNTQYDPYIISTADELAGLAKLCHEGNDFKYKHFALAGDIDLGGREWFSIGWFDSYTYSWFRAFNGTFDGRGYAITGLNSSMGRFGDLFGYIGPSATVKNLVAEGRSTGSGVSSDGAAILTAWLDGRVENCVVSGEAGDAGGGRGFVGLVASLSATGSIRNVLTYGVVDASGSTSYCYGGGIIGYAYAGGVNIENCVVYADAIKGGMDAGGIIGGNLGLTRNTHNNVSLAGYMSGEFVGGVTGLGPYGENNYWLKEPGNENQPLYAESYFGGDEGDSSGRVERVSDMPVVAAAPMKPLVVRVGSQTNAAAFLHPSGGDRSGLSLVWTSSNAASAAVSGSAESAVVTGMAPGTATVTLTMTNPSWKSSNKEAKVTVSFPVTVMAAGDGPLGLSAYQGNKRIALGWDAQAGATKYRVRVGGEPWIDVPPDRTDYMFIGLENGIAYTFSLEAVFAGSTASDSVTVSPSTATEQIPPSAPMGLAATPGDRSASVSWSAPEDDGGSAVTGYEVSSGGAEWTPVDGGAVSHTFTGLYLGREYELSVRAVNAAGPGTAAAVKVTLSSSASVSAEDAAPEGESWSSWLAGELGLAEGSLKVSDEGYLVIDEESAIYIARAAALPVSIDEFSVTPLPVVEKRVEEGDALAAFYFNVKGGALLADRPSDVLVMKVLGEGGESAGELFTHAPSRSEFGDKRFTVLKRGAVFAGEIDPDEEYVLALFVEDGGAFDLQAEDGWVVDPAVILKEKTETGEDTEPEDTEPGGGGGCGALGFAALAVIVPAVLTAGRKGKGGIQ
jgi:hypothetical protein